MDARWKRFGREWANILQAKTPQEFEIAVNAHPLVPKTEWHSVAGAFARRQRIVSGLEKPNDCHNNEDYYKDNMVGAAVFTDGMRNDTIYTTYS